MTTATTSPKRTYAHLRGIMTASDRADIIRRTFGTWKRPLKQAMRELSTIRRGLDRKLP